MIRLLVMIAARVQSESNLIGKCDIELAIKTGINPDAYVSGARATFIAAGQCAVGSNLSRLGLDDWPLCCECDLT
jgi:hypothetical protein